MTTATVTPRGKPGTQAGKQAEKKPETKAEKKPGNQAEKNAGKQAGTPI